eukprot:3399814-Prymnesium_polylepis.1
MRFHVHKQENLRRPLQCTRMCTCRVVSHLVGTRHTGRSDRVRRGVGQAGSSAAGRVRGNYAEMLELYAGRATAVRDTRQPHA